MNDVTHYQMDNGQPAMEYQDEGGTRWRWQRGRHWIEANGTDTINLWNHEAREVTEPYEPGTLTRHVLTWQAEEHERLTEIWGIWEGAAFEATGEWQTAEEAERIAQQWMDEAREDGASVQIWTLDHEPECWAAWNDPNNDDPEPCHCRQFQADHRPAFQYPEED